MCAHTFLVIPRVADAPRPAFSFVPCFLGSHDALSFLPSFFGELFPRFEAFFLRTLIDWYRPLFDDSLTHSLSHSLTHSSNRPTNQPTYQPSSTHSYTRCCVVRQIRVAVSTRRQRGRTSAQPVPGGLVAARGLRLCQLLLQLLRLLRHGVTLPGHAAGASGKEGEETDRRGNCRQQ